MNTEKYDEPQTFDLEGNPLNMERIAKEYKEGKGVFELTLDHDASLMQIQKTLELMDVRIRTVAEAAVFRRKDLPMDEVIRKYEEEGLSTYEIAIQYNVSSSHVSRSLRKARTQMRYKNDRRGRPNKIVDEADVQHIIRLYTVDKVSPERISNEVGISHVAVRNLLRRNNVRLRTASESARLRERKPAQWERLAQDDDFKKRLYALRYKENKTFSECSRILGVGMGQLEKVANHWKWGKKRVYKKRKSYKMDALDAKHIIQQYTETHMSLKAIGEFHHVSSETIKRLLVKNNVPIYPRWERFKRVKRKVAVVEKEVIPPPLTDVSDVKELKPGDLLFYRQRTGEFTGITQLTLDGKEQTFLTLKFQQKQQMHIPVSNLDKVKKVTEGSEVDRIDGKVMK